MFDVRSGAITLLVVLATLPVTAPLPSSSGARDEPIAESAIPHIRAGLWDIRHSMHGHLLEEHRYCDRGSPVMQRGAGVCVNVRYARTASGGLDMSMDCTNAGHRFHLHQVVTGDPQTAFASDYYVWDLPKPLLGDDSPARRSQRYLGPCPRGMAAKNHN